MRGSAVKSRELPAAAPRTGFTLTEEKDKEAGGTKLCAAAVRGAEPTHRKVKSSQKRFSHPLSQTF
jgi:hypothetical protein